MNETTDLSPATEATSASLPPSFQKHELAQGRGGEEGEGRVVGHGWRGVRAEGRGGVGARAEGMEEGMHPYVKRERRGRGMEAGCGRHGGGETT